MDFMYACKAGGFAPIAVQGIILTSETVLPTHIEELKAFYGDIPVFIDYGHTERVVGAYRVDDSAYNFIGPYGIARVVNGEIVGTSLDNMVMPYINYKTGDEVTGEINCYSGTDIVRSVENIKGRVQDYLVTHDYRLIPLTTLYVGHHLPSDVVLNLQYQQREPGKVTVLIQKSAVQIDKQKILNGLKEMVKEGIFFELKFTQQMEKTHRGKRMICKQMLDIEAMKKVQGRKISQSLQREKSKDLVTH